MSRRRNRRGGGKRKNKRGGRRAGFPAEIPKIMCRTFRYATMFTNSGAAPQVTKRFLSNTVWRPEVSVAKSAVPFGELQELYSEYRVLKYRYCVTIVNNESFPVVVYVTNTNADPSVSAGLLDSVGDLSQRKVLSPKGGLDKVTFRKALSVQKVVGEGKTVRADDDYRGLMSAGSESNPADVTWIGIGAQSMTGANITLGVTSEILLEFETLVYDRQIMSQGGEPVPKMIDGVLSGASNSTVTSLKAIYN